MLAAMLIVHQTVSFSSHTWFASSIHNSLHVPLFAIATVIVGWLVPGWPRIRVIAAMAVLAVITEGLQLLTNRAASLGDLVLNGIGIAIGALFLFSDRPRVAVGLLIAATAALPAYSGVHKLLQARAFPVLYDPDSRALHAYVTSVSNPQRIDVSGWSAYQGRPVLTVTWADADYPIVIFEEPVKDWRGYTHFVAEVFNPSDRPQRITLGISHRYSMGPTVSIHRMVAPGAHDLTIPLDRIATDENGGVKPIYLWQLHSYREWAGEPFWIGRVYLTAD